MTKPKTSTRLNVAVAAPSPDVEIRPKLILLLGRGSRGKTLLARWMIDRAANAGRTIVAADGDRTNRTLARYFVHAVSPASAAHSHAW